MLRLVRIVLMMAFVFFHGLIDQAGQMGTPDDRFVVQEGQAGHQAQAHAMGDFAAQEAGGALQTLDGFLGIAGQQGEPDLGVLQVRSDLDRSQGDALDARILDFAPQDVGQFLAELFGDAFGTGEIGGHDSVTSDG